MNLIKNLFFVAISFIVIVSSVLYLYLANAKKDIDLKVKSRNNIVLKYLKENMSDPVLQSDFAKINSIFDYIIKEKNTKKVELEYKKYVFTKNMLLQKSDNIDDDSWLIGDVTTDIRFGEISELNDGIYEFVHDKNFDFDELLNIKFQSMKARQVQNSVSKIKFYKQISMMSNEKENDVLPDWFLDMTYIKTGVIDVSIWAEKENLGIVGFEIDNYEIYVEEFLFFKQLVVYSIIAFFIVLIIAFLVIRFFDRRNVLKSLMDMAKFSEHIVNNKFMRIDEKKIKIKEAKLLATSLNKVSVKIASLTNELNVSKDLIEQKSDVDDLTQLPNQKAFEFDMKKMFVSGSKGYILILKIDNLKSMVEKIGASKADELIRDFASTINNMVLKINKTNIAIYRFYGSEFAIIAKKTDGEEIRKISQKILNSLKDLPEKFNIDDNLIHIGATPFDPHGTVESILNMANVAYDKAVKDSPNSYCIVSEKYIEKKKEKLEKFVLDIINNKKVNVKYLNDTYLLDNPDEIIMQEAVPNLVNDNKEEIAIGVFITIAKENNLDLEFDKLIILSAINHIKDKKIKHKIAVNLAIESIAKEDFMQWLKAELLQNKEIADKIVFSITSFSASQNKDLFNSFVNYIHKVGAKIILKRYSNDEISIEELENIDLDYIRVGKDYTLDINQDSEKRQMIRNLSIFGNINDVHIMGDEIKFEKDYETVKKFGFYATSR